jgi:hypothetical protein
MFLENYEEKRLVKSYGAVSVTERAGAGKLFTLGMQVSLLRLPRLRGADGGSF